MKLYHNYNYSRYAVSIIPATIILNSTTETAFPGEVVTYTCIINEAGDIAWTAAPVFTNPTVVRFLSTASSGERMLSCSDVSSIDCADIDFQAALTNVGPLDMNGLADLTSTFSFTAGVGLNQTVVECRGDTASGPEMMSITLTVEGTET